MKPKSLNLDKVEYQNKLLNFHLDPIMVEIRREALEKNVPIIQDETGAFLVSLMHILKPKRVLEIGCAVGYSSALFALNSNCIIDTLEIDSEMINKALNHHYHHHIIYRQLMVSFDD